MKGGKVLHIYCPMSVLNWSRGHIIANQEMNGVIVTNLMVSNVLFVLFVVWAELQGRFNLQTHIDNMFYGAMFL